MSIPEPVHAAAQSIDAEKIRWHVRFLSHDLLEGRGTGQRGGDIAAEYISTQFALYGLKPAGDNGGYLQKVNFVGTQTLPEGTSFAFVPAAESKPGAAASISLKFLQDYVTSNKTGTESVDVDAPIVWVGYGITAPEYNWDDYKGAELKGKVALVLVNEPPSDDPKFFMGKTLTYYGRWTYKFEELARRGAVGVLIIHRTDLASYGFGVLQSSGLTESSQLADDHAAKLAAQSWIQYETARKLFAAAGKDIDKEVTAAASRDFHPVELPMRLKAHIVSKVRRFSSNNVVAILPGAKISDGREGKDQAVLYTAHYDHLGLGAPNGGDNIYNGAADNGTGCGVLLELARAWASSSAKPPYSMVFAAVTAEEQGLLGSKYLGLHPPIPAGQISLDLNFDELLPIGDPVSVMVAGSERTSFSPIVQQTAKEFGLTIQPDEQPMAGHYHRSDHFSLARVGIPSFSVDEGTLFAGHPAEWGRQQKDDYDAHRYHQVTDEYSPEMDFTADAKLARFGFVLGWKASELPARVEWIPGDEFEKRRLATSAVSSRVVDSALGAVSSGPILPTRGSADSSH